MTLKAIQVRVHDGNLEPLEPLPLVEGSVVTVVVPFPDAVTAAAERVDLDTWNLGAMGPLTRDDIYEDSL